MNDASDLEFQRHAHQLMVDALALASAKRREWVLAQAVGDQRLAEEVLALLGGEDTLGDFLDRPAVVDLSLLQEDTVADFDAQKETVIPDGIGQYAIIGLLGSGGMGDVFHARQEQPVRREVALKRIRANLPREARERFLIEQGALARLGHSNVARFFDAGTTDDGQPYFAMELVPGEPITTFCDDHRLSISNRLKLFLQVCSGVEHAHRQQILHRDLKPSNVLVIEESGNPVPKVIDFGIAKSLDRAATDLALETGTHILGTPIYMSPEALDPQRIDGDIDTRTDVYSLGVLLYELLSGRTPFDRDDSGLIALIGRITTGTTPTPSQRLSKLSVSESSDEAERRGLPIGALIKSLRGDLDWVVSKAMATDREHRYGSVGEFAADIRRTLAHEPVEARPPNTRYRLAMFARRNRTAVVASAIALAGLLLGTAGLGYGLFKAKREAAAAQQALSESREVSNFLVGLFDASRPGSKPADQISAADLLDRGSEQLDTQLRDQPLARGRFLRAIGDVYVQIGRYDQAEKMLTQAQILLAAELPQSAPERRTLQRSFGVLALHRSKWEKAEKLLREGTRGLDPDTDPEIWTQAVHNLGVVLYRQRHLDAAMTELQRALRVRERYLPADSPYLDQSRNSIASIYLARQEAGKAAELYEKVLAHQRATLGPVHAYVGMSLRNLALAHQKLGRTADAETEFRQAASIQESAEGPDSPILAGTLMSLGRLLRDFGNPQDAEAPMRRALAIQRATLGNENRVTSNQMVSLSRVLLYLGKLDDAEKLLRESLAISLRLAQPESVLEYPRMYLGLIALERGQIDKAEPILQHSLKLWQSTLRPGHPSPSWPMLGLARIDLARGKLKEAEQLSRQALDTRLKSYSAGHVAITEAREIHDHVVREAAATP